MEWKIILVGVVGLIVSTDALIGLNGWSSGMNIYKLRRQDQTNQLKQQHQNQLGPDQQQPPIKSSRSQIDHWHIEKLKKRIADLNLWHDFRYSDSHLLRWIKFSHYNLVHAEKRIRQSVQWRRENGIDHILQWNAPQAVKDALPFQITGLSYEGNPIFYIPIAKWDLKRLVDLGMKDEALSYIIQILERGLVSTKGISYKNDWVGQIYWVVDWKGVSLKQGMNPTVMMIASSAINLFDKNYPMLKAKEFFVRMPMQYRVAMKTVKMALPFYKSLEGIDIYAEEPDQAWRDALLKYIPKESLPITLGGTVQPLV